MKVGNHISCANRIRKVEEILEWIKQQQDYPGSHIEQSCKRVSVALMDLKKGLDDDLRSHVPKSRDPRGLVRHVYYGAKLVGRTPCDPNDCFDTVEPAE